MREGKGKGFAGPMSNAPAGTWCIWQHAKRRLLSRTVSAAARRQFHTRSVYTRAASLCLISIPQGEPPISFRLACPSPAN